MRASSTLKVFQPVGSRHVLENAEIQKGGSPSLPVDRRGPTPTALQDRLDPSLANLFLEIGSEKTRVLVIHHSICPPSFSELTDPNADIHRNERRRHKSSLVGRETIVVYFSQVSAS